jgi:hypothetical protein
MLVTVWGDLWSRECLGRLGFKEVTTGGPKKQADKVLLGTLPALTKIYSWGEAYFDKSALPSNTTLCKVLWVKVYQKERALPHLSWGTPYQPRAILVLTVNPLSVFSKFGFREIAGLIKRKVRPIPARQTALSGGNIGERSNPNYSLSEILRVSREIYMCARWGAFDCKE